MRREVLDELQQMLIDERRDLAFMASMLPGDVLERMSMRMKEALNIVMEMQDDALTQHVSSATAGVATDGNASLSSLTPVKRGRGGQRGAFLREEADMEAYVAMLTRLLDRSFVDATHMRVEGERLLSATHFFACAFFLESKRPEAVECPTVKAFHQLLLKAVEQAGISHLFTLSQAALSNAVREYNAIGQDLFCNERSKSWTQKDRRRRKAEWTEEMRLVGAVLKGIANT